MTPLVAGRFVRQQGQTQGISITDAGSEKEKPPCFSGRSGLTPGKANGFWMFFRILSGFD